MIILRHKQKEYSGKGVQFIKGIKASKNKVGTAIDNLGLSIGNKLGMGNKLQPESVKKFKFSNKTNRQINREAIESKNNLKKKTITGITDTIEGLNDAVVNGPGNLSRKAMEFGARNPITTASQVGGKILMVTNPETAAIPVGGIGTGVEVALKKKSKIYDKTTQRFGDFFAEDHKGGKFVKNGTNAVVQGFKNMVGVI